MLLPNQTVQRFGEIIPVENLEKYSKKKVKVQCDYCGKIIETQYRSYNSCMERHPEYYICRDCSNHNTEKLNERLLKSQNTCLKKYGYINPSQVPEFKQKKEETCLKNYGVLNPAQSECIRLKQCGTMIENYGVPYALQSPICREKMYNTMTQNGTKPHSSKQEMEIYNLLLNIYPNIIHSYQVDEWVFDIYLEINGVKIDIECDGIHWHPLGNLRDRVRDEINKRKGFKILRIRYDGQIPTQEEILNAIEQLVNTDRKFKQIGEINK